MGLLDGLPKMTGTDSQLDKELAQLVASLMTTENIELKSEVKNPLNVVKLKTMGAWIEEQKVDGVQVVVDKFVDDYLRIMVSHRRQGRLEVVKAISEMKAAMRKTLLGPREEGV
jgi:hypothetical protein